MPVQYQLKTFQSSSGTTSDNICGQIREQSDIPEVISLSSEDEREEQENTPKRFKSWPKKADPDEAEFYEFENPYSHLEASEDSE